MEDLSRANLDDVRAFFRAFYAPSNATLAVAGDFDEKTVKSFIAHYFGTLPKMPRPPSPSIVTKPLGAEIRKEVKEPVKLARVAMGYLTPPAYTPDDTILDVVTTLLAGGKATRLYQELVVKTKFASDVSAALDSNGLTSMLEIDTTVAAGTAPGRAEKAVDDVVRGLATQGPTAAELDRAKHRIRLHVLADLQRLDGGGGESGRAGTLQRMNHYTGDPGKLGEYVGRVSAVTSEDVKRATLRYLSPTARVVVTTLPAQTPPAAEGTP
jgi:predicted Zn-dependent peptidase